jgi:glycosyltransferase involved in cell wall biosynthesis
MPELAGTALPSIGTQSRNDATPWTPEIAIVTITKDDLAGIQKTIESVAKQDYARYEHVVVDGGSRSDIAEWLASWRDGDRERRILISNPPDGIYPAMNTGIRSTTAPIIVVLNGGDELLPGTLRRVSEHHKVHGWRWAYGGLEDRDSSGRLVSETTFRPFSKLTLRAGFKWVPHPAAYVTRDLHTEVGLYREDLGTGADQEFFLRAARVAEPGQLPGNLATMEPGGVSTQEGRIGREISWHRMRIASETAFGGNSATDLVVTALLLVRGFILSTIRQIQKIGPSRQRSSVDSESAS